VTTKEADETRKRHEIGQALLKRMEREDMGEYQRSERDPEFTVEELVQLSGYSRSQVRRLLIEAGVGCSAIRPGLHGGPQRITTIVRWSQLKRLAKEFGWTASPQKPR
jgi:hypothetical protein